MLQVSALCGPFPGDPFGYLLDANGFRVLLDCGCDPTFDVQQLGALKEAVKAGIHAVLVSQPELQNLGALPILTTSLGYTGPIYCTTPVAQLGEIAVRGAALARVSAGHQVPFSAEQLVSTFHSRITSLKYHQPRVLDTSARDSSPDQQPAVSVEITAYNSGCNLGGSIWRIRVNGEDLVYAPKFSIRAEKHLDPATALHQTSTDVRSLSGVGASTTAGNVKRTAGTSLFSRPMAFLTCAPFVTRGKGAGDRRSHLAPTVLHTLRSGGNVLIPVSSVGRLIELALTLGECWRQERAPFGLALLAPYAEKLFELAKSQLEFAGDAFRDHFQNSLATRTRRANQGVINPFVYPDLRLIEDAEAMQTLPLGPKCVMVLTASLDEGPAREVLFQWAESPQNLILFVENQREGSLGRQLQDRAPDAPPVTLNAEVIERTPLEGDELLEYIRQRGGGEGAKAKEEEEAGGDAMDIDLPGSPEGEAAARLTGLKSPTTTRRRGPTHLDPDSSDSSWQTSILIDGFKSDAALAGPMFPWTGHAAAITAVDEFGEVILPGEFTGYFQEEAYDLGTNPGDPAAISADPSDYANTVDTSDPFVILTDPDQPFKIERHSRQIWFTMQVTTIEIVGSAYDLDLRFAIESVVPRFILLLRGEWDNPLETARARVQTIAQHPDVRAKVDVLEASTGPCTISLAGPTSYTLRLGPDILNRCETTPRGDCALGVAKGRILMGAPGEDARLVTGRLRRKRAAEEEELGNETTELFIGDSTAKNVQNVLRDAGLPMDFKGSGVLFSAASNLLVTATNVGASAGAGAGGKAGAGSAPGAAQKSGEGAGPQLILEGTLSEEFYRARDAVQRFFKIRLG